MSVSTSPANGVGRILYGASLTASPAKFHLATRAIEVAIQTSSTPGGPV
jgi:hypothetical protein